MKIHCLTDVKCYRSFRHFEYSRKLSDRLLSFGVNFVFIIKFLKLNKQCPCFSFQSKKFYYKNVIITFTRFLKKNKNLFRILLACVCFCISRVLFLTQFKVNIFEASPTISIIKVNHIIQCAAHKISIFLYRNRSNWRRYLVI